MTFLYISPVACLIWTEQLPVKPSASHITNTVNYVYFWACKSVRPRFSAAGGNVLATNARIPSPSAVPTYIVYKVYVLKNVSLTCRRAWLFVHPHLMFCGSRLAKVHQGAQQNVGTGEEQAPHLDRERGGRVVPAAPSATGKPLRGRTLPGQQRGTVERQSAFVRAFSGV